MKKGKGDGRGPPEHGIACNVLPTDIEALGSVNRGCRQRENAVLGCQENTGEGRR